MAFQFDLNRDLTAESANDDGALWYHLKEFLKLHGWVVSGSGDGNAAFEMDGATAGSGGQWDVFGSVADAAYPGGIAGSWTNDRAWIILRSPSGYEILFERSSATAGSNDDDFAGVRVSPGGYSSAGASATVAPAAPADELVVFGSASRGITGTSFINSTLNYRMHIVTDDAAAPGSGEYGFLVFFTNTGTGAVQAATVFFDPCEEPVAGDPLPVVCNLSQTANYSGMDGAAKRSLAGSPAVPITSIKMQEPFVGGVQIDGEERHMQAIWFDNVAGIWKGISHFFRSNGGSRTYPDTINLAVAGQSRIYVEQVTVPWETGTSPL